MREKIAEIVNCMREDKKGDCEFCSWPEDLCPVAKQIKALEALFTAETAAMREALEKIARVWEQSSLQGEGELRNDLMMTKHIADTALKGGIR